MGDPTRAPDGPDVRYDPLSDALTVRYAEMGVHTAHAAAHDSLVTLLCDAHGYVAGVTLHEASAMLPADWELYGRDPRVPPGVHDAVRGWLRVNSRARVVDAPRG